MEGKVKTRTGAVPRSLGRQIGVLPVSNPPPRIPKRPSESASTSSRVRRPPSGDRRSKSNTSLQGQHASSLQNYGQLKSPSSRSIQSKTPQYGTDDEYEYEDFYEQDVKFYDIPNSSRSSVISSSRSLRSGTAEIDRTGVDRSVKSKTRLSGGSKTGSAQSSSVRRNSYGVPLNSKSDENRTSTPELGDEEQRPEKTIDAQEVLQQNFETDHSKIYEICMHAAELTTIGNLEKFKKLRVLDLSCNFIQKIENLDKNQDLRELKLYDNKIKTVEQLQELKELCSLQLQHNKIKQIGKGLSQLKKLKFLRLDCNQILKIEAAELSSCLQITTIDISHNMLDSLSALNYLPNLEDLTAVGNRLKNVEVSRCKKLNEVNVSGNRITDLSGLKGLVHLKILNISNNNVITLKAIGKSKSLTEIHAANNKITEMSYFCTYFPRLEIINVANNAIENFDDVCSLSELEDLAELFISENPFCTPGGQLPHYVADTQLALPQLEILDGAHLQRHSQKGTAPLMRPMSASTIVSVRQMESQLKTADEQMLTFQKSIQDLFDTLRETCERLPEKPPSSKSTTAKSPSEMSRPSSKSSSRSRIHDAMKFASENFS